MATIYGYDDIDQLTSESRSGYSASYTYDANGNRLTRTVGGTTESYYYDDADKLTHVQVGGNTVKSYAYDDAGRTTSFTTGAGTTTFTYDYDGKVTGVSYPGSVSDSFTYNGLGARVSTSGTNGSRTFRRAGIGVTSSVLDDGTRKYTPGVSSRNGSTSTFQHSGLKNATEQSNSSQSVTATRKYDAFGNVQTSSGTWQGPFGYAGSFGYQEDPNGLKLLGHRYYDSGTGRFLTSDPIGSGSNWYAYAGGNPISNADPTGLRTAPRIGEWGGGVYYEGTPTPPSGWQIATDFAAGMGDGLTFGGTAWVRGQMGTDSYVNEDSGAYVGGEVASVVLSFAMGNAGGVARAGWAAARGGGRVGARLAARAAGTGCFTEGTDVIMADDSTKDIEDVVAGDEVATWDPATGERMTSTVARTFVLDADGVFVLRFSDGETIEATAEHPFFVPGKGWIHAAGLKKGDRVKSTVLSSLVVSVSYRSGATKVYNFEVARTHTYYVGGGKLVHNRCAFDGHHWVPKAVSGAFKAKHGVSDDLFDEVLEMPYKMHQKLHGRGGGAWNKWWWEKIDGKGGIGNVTLDDLKGWADELEGLFW